MSYFDALSQFGDRPALISEEGITLTYAQLSKETKRFGTSLVPRIHLPNTRIWTYLPY